MLHSIVIAACAVGVVPGDDLKTLLDAHDQAVALIHALDVKYEVGMYREVGGELLAPGGEMRWVRDGSRERFRNVNYRAPPTADGLPTGIIEWTLDGEQYRYLRNWDPDHPQRITPVQQGTLRAEIGPRTAENPAGMNPAQAFLFELNKSPRQTLPALIRASAQARVAGKGSVDGHDTWVIEAESQDGAGAPPAKRFFEIHLDAANYLVRKFVEKCPKLKVPGGNDISYCSVQKVLEFKDFGEGAFLPIRLSTEVFRAPEPGPEGTAGQLTVVDVRAVRVNEPLPDEAFDLKFPKYALVSHYPPVNGRFVVDVWGDNGPMRRIHSLDEVKAYEAELRRDPATAAELDSDPLGGPSYLRYSLLAVAILASVLILFLLGRRFLASRLC